MALLPAYAVDGGTLPAEMLRMVAYNLSGGANGIAQPGDLRVAPLPTPGGGVTIAPGGALIRTRYVGASAQQTYAVMNDASETLTIPATGSGSGRTDYIVVRIDDPDYGGQEPDDPLTATYASFQRVSSITNLSYPFVPLARITLPSSTGTVQAQHITDLREVAIPKRETRTVVVQIPYGETMNVATGAYQTLAESGPIPVPEWATHAHVMAHYGGLLLAREGPMTGNVVPSFVGSADSEMMTRVEAETKVRTSYPAGGTIAIPRQYRGNSATLRWRGRVTSPGQTGDMYLDANTTFLATIEFTQEAD